MSRSYSAALPIAYVVLRILIVLNWFFGACILGLLVYTFINETVDDEGARRIAVPRRADSDDGNARYRRARRRRDPAQLYHSQAAGRDCRDGAKGATRSLPPTPTASRPIAWALLALQLLSLAIAAIAKAISTPEHPFVLDAGFSINGWLAVLLTFVLARVFAEGTLMREDLEGTV